MGGGIAIPEPPDDRTRTLVTDRFLQSKDQADQTFAIALSSIEQVADTIDFDWDAPDLIPINSTGISGLNPGVPTEPTIDNISVNLATFTEDVPVMKEFTPIDLSPPVMDWSFEHGTHNEDLQRPLKTKIIDGIINGGTGMLPEEEQAIYDRGITRQNIDLEGEVTLALNEFTSRGSRIPQGALVARIDDIRLKAGLRRDDLNKEIITKSADLGYAYGTFIIQQGIALENELINLFGGIEARRLDASKFTVANLVEEFRVRVEAGVALLNADVEWNKQLMAVFTGKIELFKAQLQANETEAEVQAKVAESKVKVFESQISKFNAIIEAIVKSYQADIAVYVANSDISIRHGELLSKIQIAQAEINAELIKAKSLVAAQLASAALSSVSAGANLGYSQSFGDSNSTSTAKSDSNQFSQSYSNTTRNCCND